MTPNYWDRQIERWMDVFSDDEPDLMGLELVREFDNLTKYFYTTFDEDMNEWTEESSGIYVGIRSEIMTGETVIGIPYPRVKPTRLKRIKFESIPSTAEETFRSTTGGIRNDSSEDVVVSDKNIKIVCQLPINNKKGNIKVVAENDYSISISHLNSEGERSVRTFDIPYGIDFETAKATYKNGILEVKFDRRN